MAFKRFTEVGGKSDDRISITGSYSFGLPAQLYENEGLANYEYAVLFYDEEEQRIAIHFTSDKEEKGRFSVSHYKNYGGGINAKSFFKRNNLDPKDYKGKYEWEKQEIEGVGVAYVISLPSNENIDF